MRFAAKNAKVGWMILGEPRLDETRFSTFVYVLIQSSDESFDLILT